MGLPYHLPLTKSGIVPQGAKATNFSRQRLAFFQMLGNPGGHQ